MLNIQCLNVNKVDDLCITLKELTDLKFLCFSETWATEESVHHFSIQDFQPEVNIILCEDFNVDFYKHNYETRRFNDVLVLSEFKLTPKVQWPARLGRTSISTLDQIFINFCDPCYNCAIDNNVSDHRTVVAEFETFKTKSHSDEAKTYIIKRSFTDRTINKFATDLCTEDWSALYNIPDVNSAFNYFYQVFMFHFEVNFPLKKRCMSSQSKNWVNENVKASSQTLKELHFKSRICPAAIPIYLTAKKQHKKLVTETKQQYYQHIIFNSPNPIRATWKVVSDLTSHKKSRDRFLIVNFLNATTNSAKVLNDINQHFRDAPLDIVEKASQKYNSKQTEYELQRIEGKMLLYPFTEIEFLNLINKKLKNKKLKNKKSSSPDDIPNFLVKKILTFIVKPFVFLVKLSFCCGEFPETLKTGKVTSIYKKGDSSSMANYRPVSVPRCFSKLFEYCFHDRLTSFLDQKCILSNNQHGFRSGKSTITAIHSFFETIIDSIEAGECPVGIFCDLSRAFDCVDHNILHNKLMRIGICESAHHWLESFLTNRLQYVSMAQKYGNTIRQTKSHTTLVNLGVPQGSIWAQLYLVCMLMM
nr:unnamed protein product [Callosobruchus analis]